MDLQTIIATNDKAYEDYLREKARMIESGVMTISTREMERINTKLQEYDALRIDLLTERHLAQVYRDQITTMNIKLQNYRRTLKGYRKYVGRLPKEYLYR